MFTAYRIYYMPVIQIICETSLERLLRQEVSHHADYRGAWKAQGVGELHTVYWNYIKYDLK